MRHKHHLFFACLAGGTLATAAFGDAVTRDQGPSWQVPTLTLDPSGASRRDLSAGAIGISVADPIQLPTLGLDRCQRREPESPGALAIAGPAMPKQVPMLTLDASTEAAPELELYKEMPIVVAAGMREQLLGAAPASVSVVTADDIDIFGYRQLADVLRDQRSFYLYSDGLHWFVGTRGFLRPGEWNARMLMLVDGQPTREAIYNLTSVDQDFVVPMEAIKRIEIIRGPGSALYGGNAIFSTVDVVTKNGSDVNGMQLKLTGGTQDTARVSVLAGGDLHGDWDVIGDLTGYTSQGDNQLHYHGVDDAAHNYGNIENSDYEGAESGWVKARHGDWTIELDAANRYKDNRTADYLTSFFDPGSLHENHGNATVHFDHEFNDEQSIHAMVYYGHNRFSQTSRYDDADGQPVDVYTTEAQSDWIGEKLYYAWQATESLHLLAGADAVQTLLAHQHDHDTANGPILDVDSSDNNWGLFGEVEYKASDWVTLTGGLRLDHGQRVGFSISPRAAAILTVTPHDTLKVLYGRAFRAPNLYEMFYDSAGSNTPNPFLRPEVCDTYEIAWEHQFANGWSTTVDPYLWTMSHSLGDVELPDGSTQVQNTGAQRAYGIEGEIGRKWETGARVRVYGSVGRAEQDGGILEVSPSWIIGTACAIPVINKRTFLAIDPQIVGPMKSDVGEYTDPTFITNVVLTSKDVMFKGMDLQLGVYNLFGEFARLPSSSQSVHYQPTLDYPHTQVLLSVTWRF